MTLALVQALVAIVRTMIATWTGLLVSTAFLLPGSTSRAEQLLTRAPWWCVLRGLGMALLLVIGLAAAGAGPFVVKLFGFGILVFVGAIMAVGSAGLVQTIGRRGAPEGTAPTFNMLVRGSLVFSLALGFPVVGWFVFAPIALILAAGAGIVAVVPQQGAAYSPPAPPTNEYDLSARTGAVS